MLEQSTPFRQLSFIFKLFGFQPKVISRRHKQIAFCLFVFCHFIFGLRMVLPIYQIKENPSFIVQLSFQCPIIISLSVKMVFYFFNFGKMETFKTKMAKLFNNCDGNFIEAFKAAKTLSLLYFVPFLMLAFFGQTFSWFTRTPLHLYWKLPIVTDSDLYFKLLWIEETMGAFYNVIVSSAMDMYPFCITIMLREYLNKLNDNFRSVINREEFLKCVNKQRRIRDLVREFQDIFSPLFFIQALQMIISFGATLLILTSKVSRLTISSRY
jgi:7tm Odorant receptor